MKRILAGREVNPVGLGCMNLSHGYGEPLSSEDGTKILHKALDLGIDHFDSAALYGFGANEKLLGPVLKPHRNKIFLVTKGGMRGVDGERKTDGRPEIIKETCEQSLRNLQTDHIDLYYLHRWDLNVPFEDSLGALMDLKQEGKVLSLGLSEVPAEKLKEAHAQHPIAAVQSEYSLWSRNAELGVLDACEELGIAFVAFSPVGRGFLADLQLDPAKFSGKDIRNNMPRFQPEHFNHNTPLRARYAEIAERANCTPAQLALAWLLQKSPTMHVIPGTTSAEHLEENADSVNIELSPEVIEDVEKLINQDTVSGPRYPAGIQQEIRTEKFPSELD